MVENGSTWVQSPKWWVFLLLAILVALGAVLFQDPVADPPSGPQALEGQLLLGARARVPGQDIPLGEWRPALLVPVHVRVNALAFRTFGVRIAAARGVTAAAALLGVLVFFSLARRAAGPGTALLAALFLAVNPIFLTAGRTALPAVLGMLLMLLTVRLWVAGAGGGFWAFLSGAGVLVAGLAEDGPTSAFFLLAALLVVLFTAAHGWKMTWSARVRRRLGWFWFGFGLALVVLLISVLAHWRDYGIIWEHFLHLTPRSMATNVVRTPSVLVSLARHMPVLSLVALGYFLFFAKGAMRPVARHRRLDEVRLWFLGWILAGIPFTVLVGHAEIYSLALLLPPVSFLAAEGIVRLYGLRRVERPHIDVMIVMLLIAASSWFLAAWLGGRLIRHTELGGYWHRHEIRATLVVVFALWLAQTYLLGWLYLKWKRHTIRILPRGVSATAVLLGVAVIGMGVQQSARWWVHRTHQVERDGELIRDLPSRALVAGSWAPLLTLGYPARATIIWPEVNSDPAPWHAEVTHLVLQSGRESDPGWVLLSLFAPPSGPLRVERVGEPVPIRREELTLYRVVRDPGLR